MCHYFRVSKSFMLKRVMSGLFVEFLCLAGQKHFVDEPFYAVFQKNSANKKVYGREGGGSIKIFRPKFFVS